MQRSRLASLFLLLCMWYGQGSLLHASPADPAQELLGERTGLQNEREYYKVYPFMEKAQQYIAAHDNDAAVKELEKALRFVPDYTKARWQLVVLLADRAKHAQDAESAYTEAIGHALRLQAQYPGNQALLDTLVTLLSEKAMLKNLSAAAADALADTATKLYEAHPRQEGLARLLMVLSAEKAKHSPSPRADTAKALTYAESLHRLKPNDIETLFYLAELYDLLGEREKAVSALHNIQQSASAAETHRIRSVRTEAELERRYGNMARVELLYTELADRSRDPADLKAAVHAAVVNTHLPQALRMTETLLSPSFALPPPERAHWLAAAGNLAASLQQPQKALALYREALQLEESPLTRSALATVQESMGQWREALDSLAGIADADALVLHRRATLLAAHGGKREKAEAIRLYQQVLAQTNSPSLRAELYTALGWLHMERADAAAAVRAFEAALQNVKDARHTQALQQALAQAHLLPGGNPALAEQLFEKLSRTAPNKREKARLLKQAGYAALSAGNKPLACTLLQQSADNGLEEPGVRLQLALLAVELRQYDAGIRELKALLTRKDADQIQASLALAEAYLNKNKPGLAQQVLARFQAAFDDQPPPLRTRYFRLLGRAHAEAGHTADALVSYSSALGISRDPEERAILQCRKAVLLRHAQHPQEALSLWDSLDSGAMPSECREIAALERARNLRDARNITAALDAYEKLMEQNRQPGASRQPDAPYEYAVLQRHEGRADLALPAAGEAVQGGGGVTARVEHGYAALAMRDDATAVRDFEAALAEVPTYLPLYPELGYAHMRLRQKDDAVHRFKESIDLAPDTPQYTPQEKDAAFINTWKYRTEIRNLQKRLYGTLSWGYSSGQTGTVENAAIARSASGLELLWNPYFTFLKQGQELGFVVRSMWSTPTDSTRINLKHEAQGAAGIRFKPFAAHNMNVGVERLFKLGDRAEESWLFRLMGSWGPRDVQPLVPSWLYWFAYAEADAFVGHDTRNTGYLEGRLGWTWNVGNRLLITPHIVADVRVWDERRDPSYIEAGPGLSLRWFFNDNQYETWKSDIEILLQYKAGTLFHQDGSSRRDTLHALFATVIYSF